MATPEPTRSSSSPRRIAPGTDRSGEWFAAGTTMCGKSSHRSKSSKPAAAGWSRRRARRGARTGGRRVYALYPDGRIDSAAERQRHPDRLVLQFPLRWYSTPALLKAWQDCVLTPLIYRETDAAASTVGLPVLAATTTGGPLASYDPQNPSVMSLNDLFGPLRGTAVKCRWEWQPPFAIHDVRNLDKAAFTLVSEDYRRAVLGRPILRRRSNAVLH